MRRAKSFMALLLLWIFLLKPGWAQPAQSPPKIQVLTKPTLHILESADHVEAYRIKPVFTPDYSVTNFDGFPLLATNSIESEAFIRRLVMCLKQNKDPAISDCIFSPGVALRARTKQETVDLLICFNCSEAMLTRKDDKGKTVENVHFSIRHQRGEFLKLALQAFPEDEELRGLK